MDAKHLTLRKMTLEGIPHDDDWLVMWRGLNIGRILKQSGVTMGVPAWFWGINVSGRPQPAHWKVTAQTWLTASGSSRRLGRSPAPA